MAPTPIELARTAYAEKIRDLAGLRSPALFRALGRVPREEYVGPGPWKILLLSEARVLAPWRRVLSVACLYCFALSP